MRLDQDIHDQACGFFLQEAPQLLEELERELLLLAKDKTVPRVHSLMRSAHSLKGGAATVGLESISQVSHRLEDVFKALYGNVTVDSNIEQKLLEGFDALKGLVLAHVEKTPVNETALLAQAEQAFQQLEQRLAPHMGKDELISSADLGIDMNAEVFADDVAPQLQQWADQLAQGQYTAHDFTDQAEILLGLGQLTGATGFERIAESIGKALKQNPHQVAEIAQLGFTELRQSQQLVLNGEPTGGKGPSAQLRALEKKTAPPKPEAPVQSAVASLYNVQPTAPAFPPVPVPPPLAQLTLWQRIQSFFGLYQPPLTIPRPVFPPERILVEPVPQVAKQVSWTETPTPVALASEPEPVLAELSLDDIFGGLHGTQDKVLSFESEPGFELDTPVETTDFAVWDIAEEVIEEPSSETIGDSVQAVLAPVTLEEVAEPISLDDLTTAFASLPQATDLLELVRIPVEIPTAPENKPEAPARPTMRIDAERINRLNNLVGELVISRNGLALQHEQLQSRLLEVLSRVENLQDLSTVLQEYSDTLLTRPRAEDRKVEHNNFDSLELDRYSNLYELLQEVIEELGQLKESTGDLRYVSEQSGQQLQHHSRMLTDVRDDLMWARMLPLGEIFNRIPRLLRDLSAKYAKPLEFKITGQGVLVDRIAIEKLYTPLVHLVRNAFDHGIESSDLRLTQGKSELGTIELAAYHQGSQTVLEIRDDGRGLDVQKITQKAISQGLLTIEQAQQLASERLVDFIFEPGFSTADTVSDLSGRGVGLDVVRLEVQSLKGTVTVSSIPGQGTTFAIRLPLTLTVAKLLIFKAGNHTYALPLEDIVEILIPRAHQYKTSGSQKLLWWREKLVPLEALPTLLGYGELPNPPAFQPVILMKTGDYLLGLVVDQFVTEQELTIKPFGATLQPPPYLYGCTVLGDGTLVPVLDGATLLRRVLKPKAKSLAPASPTVPMLRLPSPSQTILLVVDDSLVQRQTLSLTLQKAGYRTVLARDGQEALDQLRREPGVTLVLCDIEMPGMDGFEFLQQCRQEPQLAELPVVMVTSRTGQKHQRMAQSLGAQGYLSKPFDQQQLLITVQDLLNTAKTPVGASR